MSDNVILALPSKGVIAEPTMSFLRDCGLRVENPNPRQYIGSMPSLPALDVLFQRVTDVVYKVSDGTVHLGITGLDVVREHPHENLMIIHDGLNFGHCQLLVAVPESWIDVEGMDDVLDVALDFREQQRRNIRVATKYPMLTRQFLHAHGIHHFMLVKAEGAIEAAPTLGYADIIVDLTQTGTTLRENHLKPLPDGIVLESQACLVGNRRALRQSAAALDTVRVMLEYVDAALQGHLYYQVTANVGGDDAELVAQKVASNPITRGLQGPTIAPIYSGNGDGQWHTVTVVIASKDLLQGVEHLRAIGGTQTVVTPVRYVFMENSPTFTRLLAQLQQSQ